MSNVLITTKPDDIHAIFVKLALEQIGYQVDLWYTADFPSQQIHSFELVNNEIQWDIKGLNTNINNEYNIVWYRRPSRPILPNILHEKDIDNAKKENRMFFQNIWQVILPNAFWINPVNSVSKVNSKLLQLKMATNIGLKIPKTIVSNDPALIKHYIRKNEKGVIYKTLFPMTWINLDEIRLTYTKEISLNDLPSDTLLQATPGIFQEKIEKKYELRITYFGDKYIAVKIDSQQHMEALQDWRQAPTHQLKLEQVYLPNTIDKYCRNFMRQFNIVFGCFDFIVTPEDEYYFLEINEQGQFLWIEQVNPNIAMLHAFVEFVMSIGNICKKCPVSLSVMDFEDDAIDIKNAAMKLHINPQLINY